MASHVRNAATAPSITQVFGKTAEKCDSIAAHLGKENI
jgi:hypothetical protein